MCFDNDSRPPLPPIRGSALDARELTLTSRDGTRFAAYAASADAPSGAGIVIIPDVRGLHPYYEELVLRFAEAGVHAIAVDLYARTAGGEKRGDGFEYEPHVLQLDPDAVNDDVAAAATDLRDKRRAALHHRLLPRRPGQPPPGRDRTGLSRRDRPVPVAGRPAPLRAAGARRRGAAIRLPGARHLRRCRRGHPGRAAEAFDRALEGAGVEHRTVVYEGAPHSFFDRKAADHADASAAAWDEILRLHGRHRLKRRRPPRASATGVSGVGSAQRRRRPLRGRASLRGSQRPHVQVQHDHDVGEPRGEGDPLRRARVADEGSQDRADDAERPVSGSASCGRIALMSKAVPVPKVIQPASMNSWMPCDSSPAAMKIRAIPVHGKKVRRLITRAPRYRP